MKSIRLALPLALVAGFGLFAHAAIFDVIPGEASVSSEISFTVTEAGTKKPKVFLTEHGAEGKVKKYPLKVTSWDPESGDVVADIKRGIVGNFDLNVQPKGGDLQTSLLAVSLVESTIDGVTPTTGDAGTEFTINGENFGVKKGRVKVGGKPAKVLEWTETSIRVRTHKQSAIGLADVEVRNKLGTTVANEAVTLTQAPKPIKGGDTFVAKFGGAKFKHTKQVPLVFGPSTQVGTPFNAQQIKIGRTGSGTTKTFSFSINATNESQLTPGATFQAFTSVYSESTTKLVGGFPGGTLQTTTKNFRLINSNRFTVTITNRSGNRVQGTISGSLEEVEDATPTGRQITISGAKFTAEIGGLVN